jgi:hypothetical protein
VVNLLVVNGIKKVKGLAYSKHSTNISYSNS